MREGKAEDRGHRRSTSSTAASMVLRGCGQLGHKRSHSHTVTSTTGHRRQGSSGLVMGHRRTTSGALVETLDKMTGGALGLDVIRSVTTPYLVSPGPRASRLSEPDLLAAASALERRKSGAAEEEQDSDEEELSELRECGYMACKPLCVQSMASIKVTSYYIIPSFNRTRPCRLRDQASEQSF